MLDSSLRKLPCMLPDPLAPKHLIPVIRDDNADIRAVAVSVYHWSLYSDNFNGLILSHFVINEKRYGLNTGSLTYRNSSIPCKIAVRTS